MRLANWAKQWWNGFRHLALCVLMLSVVTPTAGAMWMCEGRICGVSAYLCCCSKPAEKLDALCDANSLQRAHLSSDSHSQEVKPCPQDCHCIMVVQSKGEAVHAWIQTIQYAPVYAVLPQPALAIEAPLSQTFARPLSQRGPPLRSVCLSFPSLRAPPVA